MRNGSPLDSSIGAIVLVLQYSKPTEEPGSAFALPHGYTLGECHLRGKWSLKVSPKASLPTYGSCGQMHKAGRQCGSSRLSGMAQSCVFHREPRARHVGSSPNCRLQIMMLSHSGVQSPMVQSGMQSWMRSIPWESK